MIQQRSHKLTSTVVPRTVLQPVEMYSSTESILTCLHTKFFSAVDMSGLGLAVDGSVSEKKKCYAAWTENIFDLTVITKTELKSDESRKRTSEKSLLESNVWFILSGSDLHPNCSVVFQLLILWVINWCSVFSRCDTVLSSRCVNIVKSLLSHLGR